MEGAYTGNGDAMVRPTFYDTFRIVGSLGGQVHNEDARMPFAKAKVTFMDESAPQVEHFILHAWIDISGPAAAAKVEFLNWAGNRYIDYFVLYKEEDLWKISGKVYNSHCVVSYA
jgi:hypothetical protein